MEMREGDAIALEKGGFRDFVGKKTMQRLLQPVVCDGFGTGNFDVEGIWHRKCTFPRKVAKLRRRTIRVIIA